MHPDSGTVVGLEHDAVLDVQVVIDGAVVGGFESAGPLGFGEVGQVDDVRDRYAVFHYTLHFVKLIVQEDELVPVALRPPALVGVSSTRVLEAAKHLRVSLVGGIPDSDAVFVVSDTDVAAIVTTVRTVIRDALGVVCVSVGTSTARLVRVGWVVKVDVLQTSSAGLVAGLGTDSNGVLVVPVNDDLKQLVTVDYNQCESR